MIKLRKTRKNTQKSEKYPGKLGKILVRPKKGPHFILVEESGKIFQTDFEEKTGQNTLENSEKYSPKNGFRRQNSLFRLWPWAKQNFRYKCLCIFFLELLGGHCRQNIARHKMGYFWRRSVSICMELSILKTAILHL